MTYENDYSKCDHICSGNCRRVGCNCKCGEFHCDKCEGMGEYATSTLGEDSEMIYCNCPTGEEKHGEEFKRIPVVDMNDSPITVRTREFFDEVLKNPQPLNHDEFVKITTVPPLTEAEIAHKKVVSELKVDWSKQDEQNYQRDINRETLGA